MGVDHIAGTTDLRVDSLVGRGGGSHQGGANGPTGQQTHNDPSSDPPRQVAGGVATKYQWVRNGYVPPAAGAVGAAGPAAQGAEAAAGPRAGLQRQGAGTGAQVQTQAQGRPRAPSLLHRLLDKEVRCVCVCVHVCVCVCVNVCVCLCGRHAWCVCQGHMYICDPPEYHRCLCYRCNVVDLHAYDAIMGLSHGRHAWCGHK